MGEPHRASTLDVTPHVPNRPCLAREDQTGAVLCRGLGGFGADGQLRALRYDPHIRPGGIMRTRTATVALLSAGILALAACSSNSGGDGKNTTTPSNTPATPASEPPIPDSALAHGKTAACWKAIRDQYTPGTVQLTGAPTTPPQCVNLTSDEVSAVAEDVVEHQFDG